LRRNLNKVKKSSKIEDQKDIFDEFIERKATKAPRLSVANPDLSKHVSNDIRKSPAYFNMSGGNRKSDPSTTEDDSFKELEEENKRLQGLIEYKDYELVKKKKEEEFGYDWFSDLREKFDASLLMIEKDKQDLRDCLTEKDYTIDKLHKEIDTKQEEIGLIDQKYQLIMEKRQDELNAKLLTESKEVVNIVDKHKTEIQDLIVKMTVIEKEK
jgi:hypothetical protein